MPSAYWPYPFFFSFLSFLNSCWERPYKYHLLFIISLHWYDSNLLKVQNCGGLDVTLKCQLISRHMSKVCQLFSTLHSVCNCEGVRMNSWFYLFLFSKILDLIVSGALQCGGEGMLRIVVFFLQLSLLQFFSLIFCYPV